MRDLVQCFTDGGSRGNPGPSACAYNVSLNGEFDTTSARYMGTATNNEAEYDALIDLVYYLLEGYSGENCDIDIFSDSKLVVNQIRGVWKVNSPALLKQRDLILHQIDALEGNVSIWYVPRRFNKEADAAVNECLDINTRYPSMKNLFWNNPVSIQDSKQWKNDVLDKIVYTDMQTGGRISTGAPTWMNR